MVWVWYTFLYWVSLQCYLDSACHSINIFSAWPLALNLYLWSQASVIVCKQQNKRVYHNHSVLCSFTWETWSHDLQFVSLEEVWKCWSSQGKQLRKTAFVFCFYLKMQNILWWVGLGVRLGFGDRICTVYKSICLWNFHKLNENRAEESVSIHIHPS